MALLSVKRHRGSPRARLVAELADGRAESPTETAVRLAGRERPLPAMELQFEVYDEWGRFVGRADGGFPELGIIWEYDGQGKYGELLPPGRTAADALLAQKRREARLVALGWTVLRVDHTDLPDLAACSSACPRRSCPRAGPDGHLRGARTCCVLHSLSGEARSGESR